MVTEYIMTGGRGSGKTYASMTEIHELIIAGERPTILVVFPERSDVQWWFEEWNYRFPHIPMPNYTGIDNMLGIRGRRWRHVYIEHADEIGWQNEKLWENTSLYPDAVVTYIYNCRHDGGEAHTWSLYPPDEPLAPLKVRGGFLRRYLKRSNPELDSV